MVYIWVHFFSCVLLFGSTVSGQTTCSLDRLDPVEITETDPPGTVLLTLNVSDTIKYEYELGDNFVLANYFTSTTNDTTFVLSLKRTLDLEAIYTLYGSAQLFVIVKNINEFDPAFANAPFEINVTENTPIDTSVFKLRDHVIDHDVNPSQEEILDFEILPYFAPKLDGRTHFKIDHKDNNGVIKVSVPPDYEAINRDTKDFMLSLGVKDYGGRSGLTTMKINILDADDQPPEFYEPGCTSNCYVLYDAMIGVNFTGRIKRIDPYQIQARDKDTLNYPVAYTIRGTKPTGYDSYFHQNPATGEISVIKPFSDTDDSLTAVTFFLEAKQTQGLPFAAHTAFRVSIDRLASPPTDTPGQGVPFG